MISVSSHSLSSDPSCQGQVVVSSEGTHWIVQRSVSEILKQLPSLPKNSFEAYLPELNYLDDKRLSVRISESSFTDFVGSAKNSQEPFSDVAQGVSQTQALEQLAQLDSSPEELAKFPDSYSKKEEEVEQIRQALVKSFMISQSPYQVQEDCDLSELAFHME